MQQLSQKLLGLVFSWQFPKQPRTYRSVQDDIWLGQEVQHRASLLFPREMLPRQDKLSPTLPVSSLKGLKTTSLKWTPAIHPSLLPDSLDWVSEGFSYTQFSKPNSYTALPHPSRSLSWFTPPGSFCSPSLCESFVLQCFHFLSLTGLKWLRPRSLSPLSCNTQITLGR